MNSLPALRRWLSVAATVVVFAAVLGFVGAGGLGQMLYYELSLFHQAQACTVVIAMLLLTALVDGLSATLRQRQVSAHV